jgi:hypothetical protein
MNLDTYLKYIHQLLYESNKKSKTIFILEHSEKVSVDWLRTYYNVAQLRKWHDFHAYNARIWIHCIRLCKSYVFHSYHFVHRLKYSTYKEGNTDCIKKKESVIWMINKEGWRIYSSFFQIAQATHCISALIEYRIDLFLFLLTNRIGLLFLMEWNKYSRFLT